ncbi:response regulator [Desulfonatronovibrio magnus]|uniref:response regulator n=1 Tax=Desulfonatronovibrio magnus TaxID=698827 RepID=UPI000A9AAFA7|nr:response regulator [Desulfonatronovibrio magnus]
MKDTRQDTVMIVDDTPANLNLLTDILKSQGYRVAAFPAGEDALKAASKRPPDLILLDIKMPEMDGYEVCKRIRQKDILADTPIIFISALNEPEDKVKAFSLGGVDYITKPFNDQEVQARVATHIRLRHLNRQLQTQNQQLEQLVENKVREIAESQLATIHALSELVESRDVETGGHIERTRLYCKFLALEMKESPRFFGKVGSSFVDNIYKPRHCMILESLEFQTGFFLKKASSTGRNLMRLNLM